MPKAKAKSKTASACPTTLTSPRTTSKPKVKATKGNQHLQKTPGKTKAGTTAARQIASEPSPKPKQKSTAQSSLVVDVRSITSNSKLKIANECLRTTPLAKPTVSCVRKQTLVPRIQVSLPVEPTHLALTNTRSVGTSKDVPAIFAVDDAILTAPQKESFAQDVKYLMKKYPGRQYINPITYDAVYKTDHNYLLPLEVERELVDDLAFIASCKPGGDFVTAVSVRVSVDQNALDIYIAANMGVSLSSRGSMEMIFQALENCARLSTVCPLLLSGDGLANVTIGPAQSQESTKKMLFRIILTLDRDKIFGRLFSEKSPLCKGKLPLSDVLSSFVEKKVRPYVSRQHLSDLEQLQREVASLQEVTAALTECNPSDLLKQLEIAVRIAHSMTKNAYEFQRRLEYLGVPVAEIQATKVVREVNKLAKYWVLCSSLVRKCRAYRQFFSKINTCYLPQPQTKQWLPLDKEKHRVHAEIQILIYFEQNSAGQLPRAIGVSKSPCFLCDTFIRSHGEFLISRTHGKLYSKWCLPDEAVLSLHSHSRVRQAFEETDRAVKGIRQTSYVDRMHGLQPQVPESLLNEDTAFVRTPSATTSLSSSTSIVACRDHFEVDRHHVKSQSPYLGCLKDGNEASLMPASTPQPAPEKLSPSIAYLTPSLAGCSPSGNPVIMHTRRIRNRGMTRKPPIPVTPIDSANVSLVDECETQSRAIHILDPFLPTREPEIRRASKCPTGKTQVGASRLPSKPAQIHATSTSICGFVGKETTYLHSPLLHLEAILEPQIDSNHSGRPGMIVTAPALEHEISGIPIVDPMRMEVGDEVELSNGDLSIGKASLIVKTDKGLVRVDCYWP